MQKVLKPKSKEEINNIVNSFTDYRIKYADNDKKYLQYKKEIKIFGISFHIWKYTYEYEYSSYRKKINKERKYYFDESMIERWVERNPIFSVYIKNNYDEAKIEFDKNKKIKYKYLEKKNKYKK